MVKVEVPQGAASLVLAPGVTFLQEEESVFEAMVQGWSAQMIGGRGLQRRSVAAVVSTVRRFQASTSECGLTPFGRSGGCVSRPVARGSGQ